VGKVSDPCRHCAAMRHWLTAVVIALLWHLMNGVAQLVVKEYR
jgi:hypothetical protein